MAKGVGGGLNDGEDDNKDYDGSSNNDDNENDDYDHENDNDILEEAMVLTMVYQ